MPQPTLKPPLKNPCELKPSDVDAHMVLDDDGNPWHPLDPDPEPDTWQELVRAKFDEVTCMMQARPMLSMAIAAGAGYVLGRILTARSS